MPKKWQWLLLLAACQYVWPQYTWSQNANLAIIIDDIGYNQLLSERAARMKGAFTLSILPFTPYASTSAHIAQHAGKELMLHLPMSSINNLPLGKGGLVSGMQEQVFIDTLSRNLDSLPQVQGVNNHMGSRLTQEAEPMQWLMQELGKRGLYFVDSRTSVHTLALEAAKRLLIPSMKRDVFLDDQQDERAIEFQLQRAIQFAKQRGAAVAIGHPYPKTLAMLERIEPVLQQAGVTLVHVSTLLTPPLTVEKRKMTTEERTRPGGAFDSCAPPHAKKTSSDSQPIVDFYDKASIIDSIIFGY